MAVSQTPKYTPVKSSARKKNASRRRGMQGRLELTGLMPLSRSASDEAIAQATEAGCTPTEIAVWYGVNKAAGSVGMFFVKPGYPGAVPVVIGKDGRDVSVHLGAVFDQHPDLRPATKVKPVITVDEDGGKPCLSVQITGAKEWTSVKRGPRKKKTEQQPGTTETK